MKIKRFLVALVTLMLPAIFGIQNVSAGSNDTNITYQRIDGAYFYIVDNSTGAVDTNHVTKFLMNGKVAFCIEPMTDITTRVYSSTEGLSGSGYSADVIRKIELYGHYGYDYPGHQTDRYWLATQKLIWESAKNVSVKFTTGANGSGSVIDLSGETNEILRLANHNDVRPDFNVSKIEGNIGDTITLTDKNGVLDEYNMTYNGKHQVSKNGNTLTVTLHEKVMGLEDITFTRKAYDSQTTILYYQGASQKIASLRVSDPSRAKFTIQSNGATVEIIKKGEKLVLENASYHFEEITLKDVTYAVYSDEDILDYNGNVIYKKYDLVGTIKTLGDTSATLSNLYLGKYFLVEGETNPDHVIDNQKYNFEITKEDLMNGKIVKHFDFKNYLKKGTLDFTKTDLVTSEPIPNTTIQIFTADEDRLIFTGKTDQDGRILITDLPINVPLYMIESCPADNYQITDEKISFIIKENGEVVKAELKNEKKVKPEEPKKEEPKEVVKVPDTKMDDHNLVTSVTLIASGFLLLIITCFALYFNDKRQK